MKTKRFYEKPSMKVFELRRQPQLLAGSGNANLYGAGVNEISDDYSEW